MSPSGTVTIRDVNPVPGVGEWVATVSAATIRSFAFVVVTGPAAADVLLPLADAVTSTGLVVAMPLYSAMRMSAKIAACENVTVTALAPAAAETLSAPSELVRAADRA